MEKREKLTKPYVDYLRNNTGLKSEKLMTIIGESEKLKKLVNAVYVCVK